MQIRPLVDADIPAVSALVCAVARSCILHQSAQAAAQAFLAENDDAGVRGFLAQGHVYHVALIDGELAGVVAVRDNSHLVRLFVATKRQRLGVARRLWQVARAEAIARGGDGAFTVNSSNHAVAVYESFGFVRTGPMQLAKGLYYNPMRNPPGMSATPG